MPIQFIPFTSFMPAGSAFGSGLAKAQNVIPAFGTYYSFPGPFGDTIVADGPVTGMYAHIYPSGAGTGSYTGDALTTFMGVKSKIYTGAWTDISRGGGYAVAAGAEPAGWRFASDGNDVWAANGYDILQRRTNNAGNFADGPTSTFTPKARFIAKVRQFMVVADLSGNGAGYGADEIAWSDIDDSTWWDDTTGTRKDSLAGRQPVRSRPGQITGFVGGEYGTIFKRNSIHALQLTGADDVWRLDEIDRAVGCTHPGSVIAGRAGNFFYGGDGFYLQAGLSPAQKISPPSIDEMMVASYFHATRALVWNGGAQTMAQEDLAMVGFESRRLGVVGWLYSTMENNGETKKRGLLYNPQTQEWAEIVLASGIAWLIGLSHTMDDSLSQDLLRVRAIEYGGGISTQRSFVDYPLAASLCTKRMPLAFDQMDRPRDVTVKGVLPVYTYPETLGSASVLTPYRQDVSVTVRGSNDQTFALQVDSDGTTVSPRSDIYSGLTENDDWGWLPHNVAGRFFDFQIDIPSSAFWTTLDGIYVLYE